MPVPLVTAYVTQKCKVHDDALVSSRGTVNAGSRAALDAGLIKIDDTYTGNGMNSATHGQPRTTAPPLCNGRAKRKQEERTRRHDFLAAARFGRRVSRYVNVICYVNV